MQHAEKRAEPGDPDVTPQGRHQAARTATFLSAGTISALYSSPLRRAMADAPTTPPAVTSA